MVMHLRNATHEDIPAILEMARTFVAESAYGYTFSEDGALGVISGHLADPFSAFVLAEDDGLAGAWMATVAHEWTVEPVCYVIKFYVMPRYRGTRCSRMLAQSLVDWADAAGCRDTFATATANVGANPMFVNLLRKYGFVPCGDTMVRRG